MNKTWVISCFAAKAFRTSCTGERIVFLHLVQVMDNDGHATCSRSSLSGDLKHADVHHLKQTATTTPVGTSSPAISMEILKLSSEIPSHESISNELHFFHVFFQFSFVMASWIFWSLGSAFSLSFSKNASTKAAGSRCSKGSKI